MAKERVTITGEELLNTQVQIVENFRGREIFPEPPKELSEFIERTSEKGYTFQPYLIPSISFTQDAQYPGLFHKPSQYFYDLIRRGVLLQDATRLPGPVWAAMETLQKPNYDGGKQLYENDPLAPDLEHLREMGKIEVPDWCLHVPAISRFGVSALELERYIHPPFTQKFHLEESQMGVAYLEYVYFGNTAHEELGKTNTAEWFTKDKLLRDASRLIGGDSDHGGLSYVYDWHADAHSGVVGFRLGVVFPSK